MQPATPTSWWAKSSAGMCSNLDVMSSVTRRLPASVDDDRLGVSGGSAGDHPYGGLEAQQIAVRLVAGCPAARGRKRGDGARASARGQLKRHEAAERVAGHVRRLEARFVQRPLHGVHQHARVDLAVDRRPARVTRERERQDVVAALEGREDELPDPPRVHEAVKEHERRPGAATVGRGEGRDHAAETSRP